MTPTQTCGLVLQPFPDSLLGINNDNKSVKSSGGHPNDIGAATESTPSLTTHTHVDSRETQYVDKTSKDQPTSG